MNQKKATNVALAVAVAVLLTSSGAVFGASPTQALNLSVLGTVTNAGNQSYNVQGGVVVFAMIDGQYLNPGATLQYTLTANVNGVNVGGNANFKLAGVAGTTSVTVDGKVPIQSMPDAIYVPIGCNPPAQPPGPPSPPAAAAPAIPGPPSPPAPPGPTSAPPSPPSPPIATCNSAIPTFFQGNAPVQVTGLSTTPSQPETMQFESPYLNPWGAPIVIASTDGSIVIAATYSTGTIQWTNVHLGGILAGTLGSSTVTGDFNVTSNENENLVAGTATDQGTMAYTKASNSLLDVSGPYSGTSVIPVAGSYDCSSLTGIPGTCTETGFDSMGMFSMTSAPTPPGPPGPPGPGPGPAPAAQQSMVSGSYQTTWGIPAIAFSSTVTATVTS